MIYRPQSKGRDRITLTDDPQPPPTLKHTENPIRTATNLHFADTGHVIHFGDEHATKVGTLSGEIEIRAEAELGIGRFERYGSDQ